MAEIVRVARNGELVVVKNSHKKFVTVNTLTVDVIGEEADRIEEALSSTHNWRRPIMSDYEKYADALTLVDGGVVASLAHEGESRVYRVPPTVKRAIAEALETYSSLLSDTDREIATRLATSTSVSRTDIEWMHKFYANVEKAFALHGGKRGQAWASKVLDQDEQPIVAAFIPEDNAIYLAAGDDPESTDVNALYMVAYSEDDTDTAGDDEVYQWIDGEFQLVGTPDDVDRELLIEVDVETAAKVAEWLDAPDKAETETLELSSINPLEKNLFELAESEIDWEMIDRLSTVLADATGYSGPERSVNAHRQPRTGEGQFDGAPAPQSDELSSVFAKARLSEDLQPVTDLAARIAEYLSTATPAAPEDTTDEEYNPIIAAGPDESTQAPLYLAIVDEVDKTAVLDAVAVIPDGQNSATAWKRDGGEWVKDDQLMADLTGDTPPVVVELSDEDVIRDVLAQIDEHDLEYADDEEPMAASAYELAAETKAGRERAAKRGYAMPDGSYPISTVDDLKKAIKAFGRAKDQAATKKHIKKRARALNRTDLLPDSWSSASIFNDDHLVPLYGPYGEIIASVTAAGVPGVADTPQDKASVERLYRYWTAGEGAAKIRWGTEGDLTRCHRHLTKYVGPNRAWGLCQNYHQRIFGVSNAKRDSAAGER